jgi:hypothetical protein
MVRISARKEVVGRPFLYATTREFLMHFGLRSLEELPPLEEFEETFGGAAEEGLAAPEVILHEREAIGLVSTDEAEAALGTAGYDVREPERNDPPGPAGDGAEKAPGEPVASAAQSES